jgi:uncharacterized protein YcfJ
LVITLGGCVAAPAMALLQALPGTNKTPSAFQDDQTVCKQFAQQSVSGQVDNANLRNFGTAALTTVLGTGLGAAIGGGQGAGIGATAGALGGGGLAAINSPRDQGAVQQQYDNAYAQCMSTKGNAVPGGPAAAPQPAPLLPQATTGPSPTRAGLAPPG